MMVLGFVIAVVGHVWKVRALVGIGILLIFLATVLLPLALIATTESPPDPEPRIGP
jgi:hypothetical protein